MKETNDQYSIFQNKITLTLANNKEVETLKISDGSMNGSGIDLVDGLFKINGIKVGICIFYSHKIYEHEYSLKIDDFFRNILNEIASSTFDKLVIAFNEEGKTAEMFKNKLLELKRIYNKEILDSITLLVGEPEHIVAKILSVEK